METAMLNQKRRVLPVCKISGLARRADFTGMDLGRGEKPRCIEVDGSRQWTKEELKIYLISQGFTPDDGYLDRALRNINEDWL